MNKKIPDVVEYLRRKSRRKRLDLDKDEEDAMGKIAIVTGANSGIGKSAAEGLAKYGATVILACRDMDKGRDALEEIRGKNAKAQLDLLHLDLEDLGSVRRFVSEFQDKYPRVDILVNNAGVGFPNRKLKSKEGFEIHMGINHLGPFLLTNLLLEHLKKGDSSRIIFVSSMTYVMANLDLDDLMMKYTRNSLLLHLRPYPNSKLANMLTCRELSKRLQGSGVNTYALCPGFVSTNIAQNMSKFEQFFIKPIMRSSVALSAKEGAEAILNCALSKDLAHESGQMYWMNEKWEKACKFLDEHEDLARGLWEKSEILTGLRNKIIQ